MLTRFGLAPRVKGMSVPAFQTHWHDHHGPHVKTIKNVRRVWQNHAVLRDGMPLLPWTGFDSCAELDFDDVASMKSAWSKENYPAALHQDTPNLVDMTAAAPLPTTRTLVAGEIDLRHIRLLTFMRRVNGRPQAELNAAMRALPKASKAKAREIFLPYEPIDPAIDSYEAVEAQWFETAEQAERYAVSEEAANYRQAIAHLVRGTERLIARVRVIL